MELTAIHTLYLQLVGKLADDFLLVTILKLLRYLLRLRQNEQKFAELGVFEGAGHFRPNFQAETDVPAIHCWYQHWITGGIFFHQMTEYC